jgi:hypothetical protein
MFWFFGISAAPCVVLAITCSFIKPWLSRSNTRLHGGTAAMAFLAVALCASLGAIMAEAFSRGLGTVNVLGYFAWCWVYALMCLPLSYPLLLLLLRVVPSFRGSPSNS